MARRTRCWLSLSLLAVQLAGLVVYGVGLSHAAGRGGRPGALLLYEAGILLLALLVLGWAVHQQQADRERTTPPQP